MTKNCKAGTFFCVWMGRFIQVSTQLNWTVSVCQSMLKTTRVKGKKIALTSHKWSVRGQRHQRLGRWRRAELEALLLFLVKRWRSLHLFLLPETEILSWVQRGRQNFFALRNQNLTNIFPLNDQSKNLIFKSVNRLKRKYVLSVIFFPLGRRESSS